MSNKGLQPRTVNNPAYDPTSVSGVKTQPKTNTIRITETINDREVDVNKSTAKIMETYRVHLLHMKTVIYFLIFGIFGAIVAYLYYSIELYLLEQKPSVNCPTPSGKDTTICPSGVAHYYDPSSGKTVCMQ